jgi:Protein of unknown function (DUF2934)
MPKQEPSIKNQSKAKATPKTASTTTSSSAAGKKAKSAAPRAKAASSGGVRRAGNGGDVAERIRRRAYEIWEREGRPEGREQAHWEQAEREVAKVRGARQAATGR